MKPTVNAAMALSTLFMGMAMGVVKFPASPKPVKTQLEVQRLIARAGATRARRNERNLRNARRMGLI